MSWKKARQSVRERMAANRRRYNEAPLRDSLEQQAIRALKEAAERAKEKGSTVFIMEQVKPEPGDIVGQCAASILRVTKI